MLSSHRRHQGSSLRILLWLGAFFACTLAHAASLTITLTDQGRNPINNAVVYITSIDGRKPAVGAPRLAAVDQINQMFVPHVRAITLGSSIKFPNSDTTQHMVYSFSGAKNFELPLYIGGAAPPVLFDKPGVVTIGCNIHDQMLGYILVLETPHFVEVNGGKATIANVPAGRWDVEIWHPLLMQDKPLQLTVDASGGKDGNIEQTLQLRPERMVRRAPHRTGSHY